MSVTAVTTFDRTGYVAYGRRMMSSFSEKWPKSTHLIAYVEEKEDAYIRPPGVFMKNLYLEDPACAQFSIRNGAQDRAWQNGYDFKYDAVRFCFKVFAFCHAIAETDTEYCVWLDADTVTHTKVPEGWVESLFKKNTNIVCLHRGNRGVETGFVAVRVTPGTREFFADYRMLYVNNAIFGLKEWHDGYVFKAMLDQTGIPFTNLTPPGMPSHPFINSVLGNYMDHMKGNRKRMGRSPADEAILKPNTGYWRR